MATLSFARIDLKNTAVPAGKLKEAERAKGGLILEDGSVYAQAGKMLFSDLAFDPATGSVSLHALFPNPRLNCCPALSRAPARAPWRWNNLTDY